MGEPAITANSNLPELTVSELAQAVRRTMERDFDRVRVRGELGRVLVARSGHLYVDLKDDQSTLSLVMWRSNVQQLAFKPEEGLEVIAEGKLSTFPGRSQYQLIADRLEPAGVGALLAQLEKLKARLAAEGLFDQSRKKPIPSLPSVIGVVTSPTGAVIRDILHRIEDRFPRRVILWPVLVQGEYAAGQIAAAIKGFNALPEGGRVPRPDVLIVARGGGSIEDLWAFNEEIVVRAAAASAIPLISAVGHETDTTLIDYASDLRAPTPTAAAERAVPVRAELIGRVETLGARLSTGLVRGVELKRTQLRAVAARLPRPEQLLGPAQQRLDRFSEKLGRALVANVRAAQSKLDRIAGRLRPEALTLDLNRKSVVLNETARRLRAAMVRSWKEKRDAVAAAGRILETLSHKSVLARGFALVQRADGSLARSAAALQAGDRVKLTFADGERAAAIDGEAKPAERGKPIEQATSPEPQPKLVKKNPADQGSLF
ncbi:MAG: exodeoxyribonuclease VII large subunit [Hyphomonadaceae bacterium]|nr:exodeoxyribonuclease VII large subunit [Hyphomonadaceae bacterium]